MNRADVLMLDNQLDELGNSFLRNRQLQQEKEFHAGELETQKMRTQADIDFRKAQGEHYNAMEDRADNLSDLQQKKNDLLEKQIGMREAAQNLSAAQQSMKDSVATLSSQVKAGKMSQEDATAYFRDAMDNGIGKSNPQMHDQMMAQPQYKAMYDGKLDWATLADQMAQQTKGRSVTGAVDMQVQHWKDAQDAADQETDPTRKKPLQDYADQLKANLPASLKQTPPAGFTDTKVTQKPNPLGVGAPVTTTNTMQRVYSPSAVHAMVASSAAAPAAATAPVPVAPADPTQRAVGQKYRSQKNPNLIATWTGNGWDTGTNAPAQQVPGFGVAQP
jgi:hypothetical protein